MGWWRCILLDVELRIKALAGYRLAFPALQPWAYPDKRFVRWVHWDSPMRVRAGLWKVQHFVWEKN